MKVALLLLLCASVALCITREEADITYSIKVEKLGIRDVTPLIGEEVSVHYTGKFLDGKVFDSSVQRNSPFNFQVGRGRVIKCWDDVILVLKLGEKVTVKCPSETAYGTRGAGAVIPANTDLIFEIEMLGFGKHTV